MNRSGKVLISVIVLFILLVSISSYFVLATETNTKTYDSSTRTVTLKNGATEIAKIKLITPTVNFVSRGKNVLVAEFTIENYNNKADAFNNMEFYNVKDNMKKFSRSFTYKYKTVEEIEVPNYKLICTDAVNEKNGTKFTTCETEQSGTFHKENNITWSAFNDKAILPKGNITLGIFTEVFPNERVEWVPTLYGIKVTEWAQWQESMNTNLSYYYNFTSATKYLDDSGKGHTLTALSGSPTTVAGIYGDGLNVSDCQVADDGLTNDMLLDSVDFTLNIWVKVSNTYPTAGQDLLSEIDSGGGGWWIQTDSGKFRYYSDGGNVLLNPDDLVTPDRWYMITIVRSGTNTTMWVNNSAVMSKPSVSIGIGAHRIYMGTWQSGQAGKYVIDEVSINKGYAWSIAEVADAWNNGAGTTHNPPPEPDTIPPSTTQPTITPSTPKSNQDLQCYATLTDDKQTNLTAYWKWYKNNVLNLSGTKTNIENGTNSLITTLSAGNTTKGEQWICEVTPNDEFQNGIAQNSTPVTILNSIPTQNNPLLSTPSGKNLSTEDLICYNQSTYDSDKQDVITNTYNWYKNNQPLTILNLPFEINAKDYSGYENDGTVYGATLTDGKVGRALSLDGINDYVDTKDINGAEGVNSLTIGAWIKPKTRATGVVNPVILSKYYAWNLHINYNNNGFVFSFNDGGGWATDTITYSATLATDTWYHVVVRYNGSTCKIFVDGNEVASGTCNGNITTNTNTVKVGQWNNNEWFNGTIDEVKIYPYALSSEQIKQEYEETKDGLTSSSKIVSQETTAGDDYMCQVTPNDGEADGLTLNSSVAEIKWGITFDIRDSYSNISLNGVTISCNYSGFNQAGDTTNPYGPYGFPDGNWECNFSEDFHFTRIIIFTADDDKTIPILMSEGGKLTVEEHTWLEWLYNCFRGGDCKSLLENINKTTTQIWQRLTGTDRSVVTQEDILSYDLSSNSNISINYTIKVPYKEGVPLNELLPIRIYFWFTDVNSTTCYSQDKATDTNRAEAPYCLPLVAQTLSPNNGTVNFQVDLRPALIAGIYNITRSIEIDPKGVWTQYGRENLGDISVLEDNNKVNINLIEKSKSFFKNSGITGAVIGNILSKDNLVFLIVLLNTFILVYFVISSKIKKK